MPFKRKPHNDTPCKVEGCGLRITFKREGVCNKHHYRWKKYGSFDLPPKPFTIQNQGGYLLQLAPGHPMKQRTGRGAYVLQHRVVLYDAIGPGPHPCHWCNHSLEWDAIQVDHVNSEKTDNRLENLVVSCIHCNASRGGQKRNGKPIFDVPYKDREAINARLRALVRRLDL